MRLFNWFNRDSKPVVEAPKATNYDGIQNAVTGVGSFFDAGMFHTFGVQALGQIELENYYNGSGIARRIVDMLPEDALRHDLETTGEELYVEMKRLNFIEKLKELSKKARLYGGAVMLMLAMDGQEDMGLALNEGSLKSIEELVIFTKDEINSYEMELQTDITQPDYGKYYYYTFSTKGGGLLKVHASRVLRLDGDSNATTRGTDYEWGNSVLQKVHERLAVYLMATKFIDKLCSDYKEKTFAVKGLIELIAQGRWSDLQKRMQIVSRGQSMLNMTLVDADNEKIDTKISNVSGYDKLIDKSAEAVSADVGIPVSLLFGRSPAGMNATGEGDKEIWHAQVKSYQTSVLQPLIERFVYLLSLQSEWRDKPSELTWEWANLEQLSDLQEADLRCKQAQADKIYIDANAVDARYLFAKRHDGGYNTNLGFTEEEYKTWLVANPPEPTVEPNQVHDNNSGGKNAVQSI
jgi:phage-related protein (TIGR01555 family)